MKYIKATIRPTMNCNMHCLHCFNGGPLNKSVLDVAKVKKFISLLVNEYDKIHIDFHGGEPLLAGEKFYKELFDYIKNIRGNRHIKISITTNGTLVTESFAKLFKYNNIELNVSFDGIFNGVLREYSNKTMANIIMLQRFEVPTLIYCVETSQSYKYLFKSYKFFNELNINYKILPIKPHGSAKKHPTLLLPMVSFVEELITLYQYWLNDNNCKIRILTFEEFKTISPQMFKGIWFDRKIALNSDGNIYPFGRPNDVKYPLGEIDYINSITECFLHENYASLKQKINDLISLRCKQCICDTVCQGFVLASTYVYEHDIDILDYSCSFAQLIFKNVLLSNINNTK